MTDLKRLLIRLALTALLAAAVCILIGCGSSGSADDLTAKPSDYPPLASGAAESPIEMLDGSLTKISDRKGKVLLVNLWGTWCGPCRGEIPHLIDMQKTYQDKGFAVLGLDIGTQDGRPESPEEIKAFVENMKMNYDIGRITPDTVRNFQRLSRFDGVPQSFLIDKEGRLRGVFVGGDGSVIAQMKTNVARVVNE